MAGTIARTCAATGVGLHLVGPLGFKIDNSRLKRAGLDYWPYVTVKEHESWQVGTAVMRLLGFPGSASTERPLKLLACSQEFWQFYKSQEGKNRLMAFSKGGSESYCSPGR